MTKAIHKNWLDFMELILAKMNTEVIKENYWAQAMSYLLKQKSYSGIHKI
jgi:hypothetical protein